MSNNFIIHQNLNTLFQEVDLFILDVFDTSLIRRVLNPEDVFIFLEQWAVKKWGMQMHKFASLRIRAESESRDYIKLVESRRDGIKIEDIYRSLGKLRPDWIDKLEELMQQELYYEEVLLVRNPLVYALYERARDKKISICFDSDNYLNREFLCKQLNECGYKSFDRIYLTNEHELEKFSGELVNHYGKEVKVPYNKILHIGDNYFCDVKHYRDLDMRAYVVPHYSRLFSARCTYYKKILNSFNKQPQPALSLLMGIQKNRWGQKFYKGEGSCVEVLEDIGFQVVGPVFYGFVEWVIESALAKEAEIVFFIARDAAFLKKIFDKIVRSRGLTIRSEYLLASRRALVLPGWSDFSDSGIEAFVHENAEIALEVLSERGVDVSYFEKLLMASQRRYSLKESELYKRRLKELSNMLIKHKDFLIEASREEKVCYMEYLKSFKLEEKEVVMAVDSVSWGVSFVRLTSLFENINPRLKIYGQLVMIHESAKTFLEKSGNVEACGYLFDYSPFGDDYKDFMEFAYLVELFLSTEEGSLRRMRRNVEGHVEPDFYVNNKIGDFYSKIKHVQDGARQFIEEVLSTEEALGELVLYPEHMRMLLSDFISDPEYLHLKLLGEIEYSGNIVEDEGLFFAKPRASLLYLFNIGYLFEDFERSHWRKAFYLQLPDILKIALYFAYPEYFWKKSGVCYSIYSKLRTKAKAFRGAVLSSGTKGS